MQNTDKKALFETAPIPKALATMAVPTIISQIINLIYNVVDTLYIGQTGDSYKVAALTVVFPAFMLTIAFSNLFGIGGGSLLARLNGRKKSEDAKKACAFSAWCACGIALLYSLVIGIFMDPILTLFGASEQTIGFSREYVWPVLVIGNIPVILSATLAHLLRNAGYSKQASIALSGGGILNMLLDPLFMFVLLPAGREVLGAAIATMLSNVASCIYLILTIRKLSGSASLSLKLSDARALSKSDRSELFSVGIPSAILTGLFDLANIFLNSLMSAHGDLQLAAIGIVMKAERLPNAINLGLCQGMMPIVAYNFASGNRERMTNVIRVARVSGLCISFFCMAMFELFAVPIISVFLNTSGSTSETALLTMGFAITFLRIRCLASPFQFLNYNSSYNMQAIGNGKATMVHALVREVVFYIPFMYLLNALFGVNGLASALVAGEGCGAIFALFLLKRCLKKTTSAEKSTNEQGKGIRS